MNHIHDGMRSAKEVLGEFLLQKANDCFQQGNWWIAEYLKTLVVPECADDADVIKTVIIHFSEDDIVVEDTDKIHSVIEMPAVDYVEQLLDEGFSLIASYMMDVEKDFSRYNLILKFAILD